MKRVLITSAIPYVNGVKHLGNLVGSMLPADIFARFCRARGYETLAICATDEHGAPIELAALEEGMPVARLLRQMARGAEAIWATASACPGTISGARPRPQNHELTLHFARAALEERLSGSCAPPSRPIPPPTAASCPTAM